MKRRAKGLWAAAAGGLITLVLGVGAVQAADWSDTFIGFRYGQTYKEPAPPGAAAQGKISKEIISLTHASGYAYGSNFFTVDMLRSNASDSATNLGNPNCFSGNCGSGGANEVYVVYRHTLSMGKVLKANLGNSVFNDVGITGGFDFNAKSGGIDPTVQKWLLGPSLAMKVPAGFWNVGIMWYHEHNHNSFGNAFGNVGSTSYTFKNTYQLTTSWLIPLPIPEVSVAFKGFSNFTGTKGNDYNGNPSRPEWLTELALMFDVGKYAGKKDTFYVGPGYQYWNNKFGTDHTRFSGANANVWQIEAEAHF
jgi:hypothetical protein